MNEIEKMWYEYQMINPSAKKYQAWSFGVESNLLANLVLTGKKTATSSAYDLYLVEGEQLPQVGTYHIILNAFEKPICIIKIIKVYVEKFKNISSHHAYKEGEGDLSLTYWKKVHQQFFENELSTIERKFSEDLQVVCEEFECVYPKRL